MSHGLFRLHWARWGGPDRTLRNRPLKEPTHTLVEIRLLIIGSSLTLHSSFLWLSYSDACGPGWLRPWIINLWQKNWYWALSSLIVVISCKASSSLCQGWSPTSDKTFSHCLSNRKQTDSSSLGDLRDWGERIYRLVSLIFHLWPFEVHSHVAKDVFPSWNWGFCFLRYEWMENYV